MIAVVSKAAVGTSAATLPLANSPKVLCVIQAMRDAARLNANLLRQVLYVVQALVNVTHKRLALALMVLAHQTLLLLMERAVAMASDVPVVNAPVEICNARLSWAVILPAMTHMLATAKPAV